MKKQGNGQNLHGELKSALKESDLVQQPAKTIFSHYFEQFAFWAINVTTLLLLFPFSWWSIALEAGVLVLAILLSRKFIKSKRSKVVSLRLWAVAVTMFLFAAVCPFIVVSKPAYVAATESNNPFAAKLLSLESSGKPIAGVMLVSDVDFVRKEIASLLNTIFPTSVRVLEKTEFESGSYYRLPVFKDFTTDPEHPGQIIWKRSVYFPFNVLVRGIWLNLTKPSVVYLNPNDKPINVSFQFGTTTFGLIDFAYIQYPNTIPWDCVRVQKGQEGLILSYAALLDRALEFFANGKTPEAIKGLESAASIIPTSNLEATRLAILQYGAVQCYLGGNVGEMQSLPYLHRAYDLFFESRNDPRFSERDPLMNWLLSVLRGGYDKWAWSACFFDRISKLEAVPHIEDEQKTYTEELRKTFEKMSYDEILKSLQLTNHSRVALNFIRFFIFERVAKNWELAFERMAANDLDTNFSEETTAEAKKAILIIKQVDLLLSQRHGLRIDPLIIRWLEFYAYEWPKIKATQSKNTAQKNAEDSLKQYSVLVDMQILFAFLDKKMSIQTLQDGKRKEWWEMDYLFWFDAWAANATSEAYSEKYPLYEHDSPPFVGPNTRELISKNGLDYFIRDKSGRTFLPGVFCIAWYAQEFGLPESESLKQQFKTATLIPFETYLSSLCKLREHQHVPGQDDVK